MAKLEGMVDDVYSALNESGVKVLGGYRYTAEISGTISAFGASLIRLLIF